jgi:hypothetical protein
MEESVKLLCPLCYSSRLINHHPGQDYSRTDTIEVQPGSMSNETEFRCSSCDHLFTAANARISTDVDSRFPANYNEEAIQALNPDELYIFNKFLNNTRFYAVNYCMINYGWPLKEAKAYVDDIVERVTFNIKSPLAGSDVTEEEVVSVIKTNGKTEAIKFLKANTSLDLEASKAYIEKLYVKRNIADPKEGCFIATACFGNYNAPEVKILRLYRDNVLKKTMTGRLFIRIYYMVSPRLAYALSHSGNGRRRVKKYFLRPLVNIINRIQH